MKKKRSKLLLISAILATAYFIYLVCYFVGIVAFAGSEADANGGALATLMVLPHMAFLGVGAIFAWLGFFIRANWAALVGAILYCISAVLFLPYFMFSIPVLIFGFIGFTMQKKINEEIELK